MSQTRARATLVIIALLFAVPVLVAVLMRSSWWDYRPGAMTNYGTLVQPVAPMDSALLEFIAEPAQEPAWPDDGRWAALFALPSDCQERCLAVAESLRQIHRAAGRRQSQLDLVLLLPPGAGPEAQQRMRALYPAFRLSRDRDGRLAAILAEIGEVTPSGQLQPGQVFLADPAGNIMMRYPQGFDPGGLNKDLKRLLKWSAQDG